MKCKIEIKEGKKYVMSREITDPLEIYKSLSDDLIHKYCLKAKYRITQTNNFDGTRTVKVAYDNDVRRIYTIPK